MTNVISVVSVPQFPNQEAISLLASPSLDKELEVRILTGAIGGRDEPAFSSEQSYLTNNRKYLTSKSGLCTKGYPFLVYLDS